MSRMSADGADFQGAPWLHALKIRDHLRHLWMNLSANAFRTVSRETPSEKPKKTAAGQRLLRKFPGICRPFPRAGGKALKNRPGNLRHNVFYVSYLTKTCKVL
jgi:hypothetical protein